MTIDHTLFPSQETTVDQPTMRLRFVKGTLQQLWSIRKIDRNGYLADGHSEWRDIPSEDE